MRLKSLHVGGLIAIGYDSTGRFVLTVSHSGRGVFDSLNWQRVARDSSLAYPVGGIAVGIGPIAGQSIPVTEINYDKDSLQIVSPNGEFALAYEDGVIAVTTTKQ
jgi:hypothetical protein